jgi:hypothetical protein
MITAGRIQETVNVRSLGQTMFHDWRCPLSRYASMSSPMSAILREEVGQQRSGITPDVEHGVELGLRRGEIPVAAAEAVRLGQPVAIGVAVDVCGDDVGLADDGGAPALLVR